MAEIAIWISKHAQAKMIDLGISEKEVKEAVKRGSKFMQTDGVLSKYRYLNVAYKQIGKNMFRIKTVYIT